MGAVAFDVGLGHMTDPSMVIGRATVPDLVPLLTDGRIAGYGCLAASSVWPCPVCFAVGATPF